MPRTSPRTGHNVISRFYCGCIHVTPTDTAIFCPNHYGTSVPSFITSREKVAVQNGPGQVHGAVAPPKGDSPTTLLLQNDPSNSVHTITYVTDPHHNDWETPKAVMSGMCPACFLDDGRANPTGIARCECGQEDCPYRWCGATQGLHGFWQLHANSSSLKLTGITENDIFSYGPERGLPTMARHALSAARASLQRDIDAALDQHRSAMRDADPARGRVKRYQAVYLTPWLNDRPEAIITEQLEIWPESGGGRAGGYSGVNKHGEG